MAKASAHYMHSLR